MERNKDGYNSFADYKNYEKKEELIDFFINKYASATMTRENIMWWVSNAEEDSIDDPTLKLYYPGLEERRDVVKILLRIKELGLDN